MTRKLLSLPFLIAFLAITAFAQQKPDFSGTWKLNVAKSDFGPLAGPQSRTDVITHKDPLFSDSVAVEGAEGKQQYTANYTTDGKEVVNKIGPREVKATMKWAGSTLVMTARFVYENTDVVGESNWALSTDGKLLTFSVHYASAMGEIDQKLVYDKQENTAPAKATP